MFGVINNEPVTGIVGCPVTGIVGCPVDEEPQAVWPPPLIEAAPLTAGRPRAAIPPPLIAANARPAAIIRPPRILDAAPLARRMPVVEDPAAMNQIRRGRISYIYMF
jgi:hypothetical protein